MHPSTKEMDYDAIDKFKKSRRDLVNRDRSLRRDNQLYKSLKLSVAERIADEKVRRLRDWELKNIWNPKTTEHGSDAVFDLFPGMGFLTAKATIEQSKLFSILRKMPKGALLHCHLAAAGNARTLIKLALETGNMHIQLSTKFPSVSYDKFSSNVNDLPTPKFKLMPPLFHDGDCSTSITDDRYTPGSWMSMVTARTNFSAHLGGPTGFDEWLYRIMTIDAVEAYQTHTTNTKIWQKFDNIFTVIPGLFTNEPVFRGYVRETLISLVDDHIPYTEFRMPFIHKTMINKDGQDVLEHRDWLFMFQEVVEDVRQVLKNQKREAEFLGAKVIYNVIRIVSCETLEWYLEDCLSLKREFPDLIAGFDLAGDENLGKPLVYYAEPLLRFQQRQKEVGISIPFIFHAGETLGDGTDADHNLYDAILLGTKRIGHGFSIVKHPHLMELCRELNIALEVCPISNEVLRLAPTIGIHPVAVLLNHGIPITLNNDDPAIFNNHGLSYDFYQVLISSQISGLITLADIAKHSFEYSSLDDEGKLIAAKLWDTQWNTFVEEVCSFDLEEFRTSRVEFV